MKLLITLFLSLILIETCYSQDLIQTRSGGIIQKIKINNILGDTIHFSYPKTEKLDFILKKEVTKIDKDGRSVIYEHVYIPENEFVKNTIPLKLHYDRNGLYCTDNQILVFEGYSKELLYDLCKTWLKKYYVSEFSSIDTTKKNSISATGVFKIETMPVGSMMNHTLFIEIKDFKIRISYNKIASRTIASNHLISPDEIFDGSSFLKKNVYLMEGDLLNLREFILKAKSATEW